MRNASAPLLKDLASINRWEYTPFCPICGGDFPTPSAMQILQCKHYVCGKCVRHLLAPDGASVCPFDGQKGREFTTGEAIGGSLEFLRNWFQCAEKEPDSEAIVTRLLNEIDAVRDALNMADIPCRVKINGGTCSGDMNCMCDHTLRLYQKKPCPLADCPNERCMFIHSSRPLPGTSMPVAAPTKPNPPSLRSSRSQRQAVGSAHKSKGCCSLI